MKDIKKLIALLRPLAEAATPGQWLFINHNNDPEMSQPSDDFSVVSVDGKVIVSEPSCSPEKLPEVCNGAYIAASNPETIITLLDALETFQTTTDEISKVVEELTSFFTLAKETLASMADDGWLMCGAEGLSEVQEKVFALYKMAGLPDSNVKGLANKTVIVLPEALEPGTYKIVPC